MTGTLGRRGSLRASPSRVEGCIFGLLSGVDVPVCVHDQLLRSSLSFDEFGERRHVELKTILFTFMLQYICTMSAVVQSQKSVPIGWP